MVLGGADPSGTSYTSRQVYLTSSSFKLTNTILYTLTTDTSVILITRLKPL